MNKKQNKWNNLPRWQKTLITTGGVICSAFIFGGFSSFESSIIVLIGTPFIALIIYVLYWVWDKLNKKYSN